MAIGFFLLGVLAFAGVLGVLDWWRHRDPRADIPRATARRQRAIRADIRAALDRGRRVRRG